MNRRAFLTAGLMAASSAALLGGCTTMSDTAAVAPPANIMPTAYLPPIYAAMPEERYPVPAIEPGIVDPMFFRRVVDNPTEEEAGTIVIDLANKFLYLVLENGKARRYGIGVGRAGLRWSGTAEISYKRVWPVWTPPLLTMEVWPNLIRYANGMPPGEDNPLGARALNLRIDGKETYYRIHGTYEAESIGKAVSSGCIRMLNQDVIDLFERVPVGTKVVVRKDMPPIHPPQTDA